LFRHLLRSNSHFLFFKNIKYKEEYKMRKSSYRWGYIIGIIIAVIVVIIVALVMFLIKLTSPGSSMNFPEEFLDKVKLFNKLMDDGKYTEDVLWDIGFNREGKYRSVWYAYGYNHPTLVDKFEKTFLQYIHNNFQVFKSVQYNPDLYYVHLKYLKKWETIRSLLSWYIKLRQKKKSELTPMLNHYSMLYFSYMYSYLQGIAKVLKYNFKYTPNIQALNEYLTETIVEISKEEILKKHDNNAQIFNDYFDYISRYINVDFLHKLHSN